MELDERIIGSFLTDLDTVVKHLNVVAGTWDGDSPGFLELRAFAALDAIDSAKKLKTCLEEVLHYD